MQRLLNSKVNIVFIVLATLLSVFNGLLSILTVLIFSGHESTRLWLVVYLPAFLWIPALACFRLPRIGFAAYAVILGTAILLCVNPFHRDNVGIAFQQSFYDLRFALIGVALLLVNIFVPREPVS
jgi:hypothetical protein